MSKYSHYRPHKRVQERGQLMVAGKLVTPPSMTKQEFVRETDINNVIKSFGQTGMFNHVNAKAAQGVYQDLPDSLDFQDSLHQVMAAEAAFMTLPAKVRDRFGQDPAQFLAFIADPENLEEARKLGLAEAVKQAPPPLEVKVVNPEEPPSPPKA